MIQRWTRPARPAISDLPVVLAKCHTVGCMVGDCTLCWQPVAHRLWTTPEKTDTALHSSTIVLYAICHVGGNRGGTSAAGRY